MTFPPAPAKGSIRMDLEAGVEEAIWWAILLDEGVSWLVGWLGGGGLLYLRCYGFGGYAVPGFVCHPDSFVVEGEDAVALVEVAK